MRETGSGLRSLAVVRGWPSAVATMREWRRRPLQAIGPWLLVSAAIAFGLLGLVWLVGVNVPADPTPVGRGLLHEPEDWQPHAMQLFRNNMLVLLLHAAACLAGFIVHMALTEPSQDEHPRLAAWTRSLAIAAIAFVPVATVLSIATQAWVLGARASTLSEQLHLPVPTILRTTLPHSVPELMAVFLPLAAWMVLQSRRRSGELLAATLLTFVVAVPVIYAAAVVETRSWPGRLVAQQQLRPHLEGVLVGVLDVDPRDVWSARARLEAGPQLGGDRTFTSLDAAITAAERAAPRTLVVLEAGPAFVVHDLYAVREPHHCDQLSGMRLVARPMSIDELAPLRMPAGGRSIDPRVHVFVQGDRRMVPQLLVAPRGTTASILRRC